MERESASPWIVVLFPPAPPVFPGSPTQLVTVKVPYMTIFNATFSDQQTYWRANCQLKPSSSAAAQSAEGGVSGDDLMQAGAEEVTYAGWREVAQGKVHEAGTAGAAAGTTAGDGASGEGVAIATAGLETAREVAGPAAAAAAVNHTGAWKGTAAGTESKVSEANVAADTGAKTAAAAGNGGPAIRPAALDAQSYRSWASKAAQAQSMNEVKPVPLAAVHAEAAAAASAAKTATSGAGEAEGRQAEAHATVEANAAAAAAMHGPLFSHSHPLQVPRLVLDGALLKRIRKPHMAARPNSLHARQFPHLLQVKTSAATSSMTNINKGGYFPVGDAAFRRTLSCIAALSCNPHSNVRLPS